MKDLIKKTEKELKTLLSEKKEALRVSDLQWLAVKSRILKRSKFKKEVARIMTLLNK